MLELFSCKQPVLLFSAVKIMFWPKFWKGVWGGKCKVWLYVLLHQHFPAQMKQTSSSQFSLLGMCGLFNECYGAGICPWLGQFRGRAGRNWLCWVEFGEASEGCHGLDCFHLSVQSKIIGEPWWMSAVCGLLNADAFSGQSVHWHAAQFHPLMSSTLNSCYATQLVYICRALKIVFLEEKME